MSKTVKDHFHEVADDAGPVVTTTDPELVARVDALEDAPPGGGAVDSVNGQTGVVTLDAADVGADTAAARDVAIAALVDSSPGALNTLNELAAALGDDANFATTITDLIAAKPDLPIAQSDVTDLVDDLAAKATLPIAQADVTDLVDDIAGLVASAEDLVVHVLSDEAHGLLKAVVDVTAEQMLTLFSAPPEIIPAPGVGNLVVVLNALAELAFGTEAYPEASLVLAYDDASGYSAVGLSGELLASTVSAVALAGPAVATAIPLTAVANKPIVVSADSDAGDVGAITTSSLGDGGADYAEDDEFTVDGGEGDATGVVDTVDGGGAVLTYHLTSFGHGYSVVAGAIANGGTGTGLTINVDSITPQGDGTLRVTVWYRIVELAA